MFQIKSIFKYAYFTADNSELVIKTILSLALSIKPAI